MLTTNGTRLDARVQDTLLDIGWDEVHVSIDGADAATHDALRGRAGAFRRTVAAVCALRRRRDQRGARGPRLALHSVVTNRNHRQLARIVGLAHALGAFRVEFDALVAYRPEQRELALSPADAAELRAGLPQALTVAARLGISTTLDRFADPAMLQRGGRPPPRSDRPGLAGAPCLKAWHHLVVQADGRTSACCVLAGEGDDASVRTLREVWERGAWLHALRATMAAGRPTGRCAECSENILAHERLIRAHLPGGAA
jgi:MoaA/NifB/PqqE/SkfB family radical SAM enzyme